jgi:hypothetical protein
MIPQFWPAAPRIWLAQVEAQFATRNISSQRTKFDHVIASLSHEYATEVQDIILSPPPTKVALFTAPPGGDVSGLVWAEWTVRCGPEGTISLESVRYPDYYLDAHHSRDCKVT